MTLHTRSALLLATACLLLPTGCAGTSPGPEQAATATSEPSASSESEQASPTQSASAEAISDASPLWTDEVADLGRLRVAYRYDTRRYRRSPDGRVHLLALDVVTDSTGERWADVFLLAPTHVYDRTGAERRLPADPVAWLRDHPTQEVLRERTVDVMGQSAVELTVDRDGAELFGDRAGGMEGDGVERYVLWQVEGTWLLLQAGTFRGQEGALARDRRGDVVPQLLRSLERVKA